MAPPFAIASCQNIANDVAVHVSQPHVAAGEAEGEAGVVESEEVEHGGMEIMDVVLVLDRLVAVFIRLAVDRAPLDAAAGQPERKAERIVVAAVGSLGEGRAAELA